MMTIEVPETKATNPALMFQDSIQEQQRYQDLIRTLLGCAEFSSYDGIPKLRIERDVFTGILMAYEAEWTKARIKELVEENTREEQE